jgi:hypothetical protein
MCVAAREREAQRVEATAGRTGGVDHPDPHAGELELEPSGQQRTHRRGVDVAVDRVDRRPERAQPVEHGHVEEVAGVEDRIGLAATLQARLGDGARAARHVGVADDRQAHRSAADAMSSARAAAARVDGAALHAGQMLAGTQRVAAEDAHPQARDRPREDVVGLVARRVLRRGRCDAVGHEAHGRLCHRALQSKEMCVLLSAAPVRDARRVAGIRPHGVR